MTNEKLSFIDQLKVSRTEGSFRELRTRGGLYVDKTKQIYSCVGVDKFCFLARPRRFGKTLLCSALEELFLANRDLFQGLWIDSSNWKWESYPLIKLDMTAVSRRTATGAMVDKLLCMELELIAENYEVTLPQDVDASSKLKALVLRLQKKFNKNVVVIIDEYDKPLLDVIENEQAFDEILGLFKSFYEQLKLLTGQLRFVFATGVFKFAKVGMFSGANNFVDLTFNASAGTLVGYTQEELEKYFDEGIRSLSLKLHKNSRETLGILQEKYNGYHFGYEIITSLISPGIYNSFGINNVFADNDLTEKWFESGSPSILLKKLHAENCQTILHQNLSINVEALSSTAIPNEFKSLPLLYFGGYLTINSYDSTLKQLTLDFPNSEVSNAFSRSLIREIAPNTINAIALIAAKVAQAFQEQQFASLQDLFNQALANIGYQLLLSQERQYQLAFFMLLNAGSLRARVEEVTQDGRIDISIEMRHVIYILELKINEAPEKAIAQIKTKDYARKYRHLDLPIWGIGIKLAGKAKKETSQKNAVLALFAERL